MYKLCSICSRTYDYILKYERLAMETQQFLKYLKWDHIIPPTVIDFNLNRGAQLFNPYMHLLLYLQINLKKVLPGIEPGTSNLVGRSVATELREL